MSISYDEFLARAKEGRPEDDLWRQLRQLYVGNGTVLQLVAVILQGRDDLKESLANVPMRTEDGIRQAIWIQGQINGIDCVLSAIHEAMKEPSDEHAEEISAEQRRAAP